MPKSSTAGGTNGTGAVIKITPAGTESVLYSFGAAASGDASSPYGNLVQATDGNFYGMTYGGGANDVGAVFKITATGIETVLHSFGAAAGETMDLNASLSREARNNRYKVIQSST